VKLVSFHRGDERLGTGLALAGGQILDLQAIDPAFPREMNALLRDAALMQRAGRLQQQAGDFDSSVIMKRTDCTLAPPVPNPTKFLLCGRNYKGHAAEMGFEFPQKPAIFGRFACTLIGAGQPIRISRSDSCVDWEGELVAVIGREGKYIARAEAMDYVVGLTCFNDVSMRDYQKKLPHVTLGKNFDTSGPLGPWVTTLDEIPDVANLNLKTFVNGELMQEGNTGELIFDIPYLIELISSAMTLFPGDLISTGTPGGVGHARKPPLYLDHGDTVTVSVDGIGELTNPVLREEYPTH
jgi:acylpyruvate hydrolase